MNICLIPFLCQFATIFESRKQGFASSEEYRGYIASKKRYFYGIRVQLLSTIDGIPVEFVFLPGEAHDTRGLKALPLNLPPGSTVYGDAGYTDYLTEDDIQQIEEITKRNYEKEEFSKTRSTLCGVY